MPTYDYVCEACGHAFEHFQSMSSKRLRTCPACGKKKLDRLVGSGAGVIFKGSGFYETDYKRAGSPPPSESGAAKAKPSGDAKDASSASETKPATSSKPAKPAKDD